MAAPRKYPDELREGATRMAVKLWQDPATKYGAIQRVAVQLSMHFGDPAQWVRQAEIEPPRRCRSLGLMARPVGWSPFLAA